MNRLILMLVVLACSGTASAQQEMLELARSDIRTARMGLVVTAMELTPAQQEAFWPIYREYAAEQDALLDFELMKATPLIMPAKR